MSAVDGSTIPPFMGDHYWVMSVVHHVVERDCFRLHRSNPPRLDKVLSKSDVVMVPPPYCYYCEQPWVVAHNLDCTGDPVEAQTTYDLKRAADAIERLTDDEG